MNGCTRRPIIRGAIGVLKAPVSLLAAPQRPHRMVVQGADRSGRPKRFVKTLPHRVSRNPVQQSS